MHSCYAKPERAADIAWLQQRLPEVFAGREVLENFWWLSYQRS